MLGQNMRSVFNQICDPIDDRLGSGFRYILSRRFHRDMWVSPVRYVVDQLKFKMDGVWFGYLLITERG